MGYKQNLHSRILSRRDFFKISGALLCGISIIRFPFFFSRNETTYKCSFLMKSKRYPDRVFRSVEEFWADQVDPIAHSLNQKYLEMGLLLRINSALVNEGRASVVTKEYKNKQVALAYAKELANSTSVELEWFEHQEYSEHLF